MDKNRVHKLTAEAFELLKEMVAIPSPSFSEDAVCTHICNWLTEKGIVYKRIGNNIIARLSDQKSVTESEVTANCDTTTNETSETLSSPSALMLCAHVDTVSPCEGYSFDPYDPDYSKAAEAISAKISNGEIPEAPVATVNENEIVAGLGSNDDGASAVSMIATFRYFCSNLASEFKADDNSQSLYNMAGHDGTSGQSISPRSCTESRTAITCREQEKANLVLVLSCEEERSGLNGMTGLWPQIKDQIDFAIVGEPTGMRAATSERGLLVIDATAHGVSGHAARNEGINAIDIALEDIQALKNHVFSKVSPRMGKVNLNVTQINAGTAHNVIPDTCTFVIDIRPTEQYTNEEILNELQNICKSELKPRNLTNRSSATRENSPLQRTAEGMGIETFSSPTTSDWMRIDCDAIKMGPGESSRSHKKDEFVFVDEISEGIKTYIDYIEKFYKMTL